MTTTSNGGRFGRLEEEYGGQNPCIVVITMAIDNYRVFILVVRKQLIDNKAISIAQNNNGKALARRRPLLSPSPGRRTAGG